MPLALRCRAHRAGGDHQRSSPASIANARRRPPALGCRRPAGASKTLMRLPAGSGSDRAAGCRAPRYVASESVLGQPGRSCSKIPDGERQQCRPCTCRVDDELNRRVARQCQTASSRCGIIRASSKQSLIPAQRRVAVGNRHSAKTGVNCIRSLPATATDRRSYRDSAAPPRRRCCDAARRVTTALSVVKRRRPGPAARSPCLRSG